MIRQPNSIKIMEYACNGTVHNNDWTGSNMVECYKCTIERKNQDVREYIQYDSIYPKSQKQAEIRNILNFLAWVAGTGLQSISWECKRKRWTETGKVMQC